MRRLSLSYRSFHSSILVIGLVLAIASSACVRTKAWQRETLAKPEMTVDGDVDRKGLEHHVLSVREGAVGGFGGGGGGCGCN